ncbi:polygalacturonase-like [Cucumis melo var. makuwa]|uniref:Polygalacturonase-like n=1 Tax=Cucumis melo var. makuwa TaxID=1194695 RepID=A0A5A7U863_CUCMM|nr:polygalacturonase-like [Cucumis melo var. makuwa]TYK23060.1 polygalacturonase-like [Cucumis melo var. makuwa]
MLFNNLAAFPTPLTFNVVDFGTKPNNAETDSSKALQLAWMHACSSSKPATIYVPKAKFYVRSATFNGPCKNNDITIRIDGALMAPSDFHLTSNSENWILFHNVNGVTVLGGILDGQGTQLWACKNSANTCPRGTTSLEFTNSQNILVNGLTALNSQLYHIVVNQCRNVKMQGLKVSAAGNSPNTDGIHVGDSSHVTILNTNIRTGDDCISIGPGSSNLWIENIACGPGHGISIGSLAKDFKEKGVQNVTVKSCKFMDTQNGVRIKSWGRQSNGFARNIRFQHLTMTNVQNPIIIDQNYCPHNQGCPGQSSGVAVSDVKYTDIRGTSATPVAIKFDCSPKFPCKGIKLEDVKLSYKNQVAKASCSNAQGLNVGVVQPMGCFKGN